MKKILLILGLILSQNITAQITLEHTFDNRVTFYWSSDIIPYNSDTKFFVTMDKENNEVNFYDTSYTLRKNIKITPPSGYNLDNIYQPSISIFNTDTKIEFLATLQSSTDNTNNRTLMKLYDEDGNELYDFGNAYFLSAYVLIFDDAPHLFVDLYNVDTNSYTSKIYSVPGTLSNKSEILENKERLPYPNPTNKSIVLPYKLQNTSNGSLAIYNTNGQLITVKKVSNQVEKIDLDVSKYRPGLYFYKIENVKHKFIVK